MFSSPSVQHSNRATTARRRRQPPLRVSRRSATSPQRDASKHVINLLQAALFNMILITYIYIYIYYLLFIHTLLAMGDQPPTARHVTHHSTPAPLLTDHHDRHTPAVSPFQRLLFEGSMLSHQNPTKNGAGDNSCCATSEVFHRPAVVISATGSQQPTYIYVYLLGAL